MRFGLALALAILGGTAGLVGCQNGRSEAQARIGATVRVKDKAALDRAIMAASGGDTILLSPGDYGRLELKRLKFDRPITIVADRPLEARIDAITLDQVEGVTFVGLSVGTPLQPGETRGTTANPAILIAKSARLAFRRLHVRGSMDDDPTNDRYGLSARFSNDIEVSDSRFEQLARGIILGQTDNIKILYNDIVHMRLDGTNFSTVHNVLIEGNRFSDYRPVPPDHPDAIQFWTSGQTQNSSDIVIRNNQIMFGGMPSVQGIFMRDEVGGLPYERVRIENNLVFVDGYNGIAIDGGRDVTITGNTVISAPGDKIRERISLLKVTGGKVSGNVVDIFVRKDVTDVLYENNLELNDDPAKTKRIPSRIKGRATTVADLVIPQIGYRPMHAGPRN